MTPTRSEAVDHTACRPDAGRFNGQGDRRLNGQWRVADDRSSPVVGAGSPSMDLRAEVLANKWSFSVIRNLLGGAKRPGELRRTLAISQKVLTETLRRLEDRGFVHRRVVCEKPLHVEYSLTELGESLRPVLCEITHWESRYSNRPRPSPRLVLQ